MCRTKKNWVPIGLSLLAMAVAPAAAGKTDTSFGVDLAVGFDTNPLRIMADGPEAPDGAFTQLRLNGGVVQYVGSGSTTAFFVDGWAATRLDESATEDAGIDSGLLRAGLALSPPFAGHRFVITAGGQFAAHRATFTDRATGLVYDAVIDPPTVPSTTIPIPERLDYDSAGAFLNLRWKQNTRWSFYLETSTNDTDYVEAYQTNTALERLDYGSVTFRPGMTVKLAEVATLSLSAGFTDLEYDYRPALDAAGDPVPGTRRSYEYTQYAATVKVDPVGPWSLNVGLTAGGRDDVQAGYYDSASGSGLLAVGRELGERNRLRFYATLRDVDYDQATVTGDPADPIRSSQEQRYAARFTHSFGERLRWYVEGGTQRTDSRDPVFAYDRDWVYIGIQYGN